jgi:hypothetical protein
MSNLLAKVKLQSLDLTKLGELVKQNVTNETMVLQDHYHVAGSMEEHLSMVRDAFNEWRRQSSNSKYYWGSILGVFDDSIVFICDSYPSGAYKYCSMTYTTDASGITFSGECTPMSVTVVAKALGMDANAESESSEEMDDQSAIPTKEDIVEKDKKVADQDGSTSATVITTDTPVGTSKDNPSVETPKTDAESPGASTPEIPAEAENGGKTAEKSDEIPVGTGGAVGSTGTVAGALANEAAGTKQADFYGKEEFIVQSANTDLAAQSMSYITVQSVEDKADGSKLMQIQGIATRGDIVNSKGQVYPTSVWQSNMTRMNEQASAGKFLGKLEHPEVEQGLVDAAIKFNKFWMQNSDVWFEATVIPTEPDGKNLQALIESGVQVDLSSRGYGQFAQSDWRGQKRQVMQDGFVCTAFDAVWQGASTGSGVKTVSYQSDNVAKGEDNPVETKTQSAEDRASAIRATVTLAETKKGLLQQSGLSEVGLKAYTAAIDKAEDIQSLMDASDAILPSLQSVFPVQTAETQVQSDTYSPTFYTKQSAEEKAPQNVGEMIERLVADLPDKYEGQSAPIGNTPTHLTSPRAACRMILQNTARLTEGAFNGPAAARSLLALEQGKTELAQDILTQGAYNQSLPTGATTVAGDGAPLSNYLIFPLIRRVFPQYILSEIAAIQPMDRPNGKIFWLDQYRTEEPSAGLETRIDLNTSSSPFNTSYADNNTEGLAAKIIRMKLSSELVEAKTKKLGAAWSIEEMQDLRAYHGLDAAQELLSGVARELALEVNSEVLNDMILQATAGALTFGTTIPATGFVNQPEWDAYIWNYIQKMDNIIFGQRNGTMTHLICGMDAALALAKSMRGTFSIGGGANGDGTMDGPYPGVTYFPIMTAPNGSRYRIMKTNFWASGTTNGSKIMCFRRGTEWNDTPYIYAPYADFTTPMLTDPSTFDQKQGIMTRFAKKCVTPNAIGTITVSSATGQLV